jgi:hypothetical protein
VADIVAERFCASERATLVQEALDKLLARADEVIE